MKQTQRFIILVLLSAIITGAGAGVVAAVYTSRTLDRYAADLLQNSGYGNFEPRPPSSASVSDREARDRVAETIDRSLVQFTTQAPLSSLSANWLSSRDVKGTGVVVSADGWTLTTKEELATFRNVMTDGQAWIRGQPYAIERVVGDTLTGFMLVKLKDASGLSPVGFAASEQVLAGERIYLGTADKGIWPLSVLNPTYLAIEGPAKAERYVTAWSLSKDAHGPFFAPTGDLLGFAEAESLATPLHQGREFVDDVIRSGAPTYAALGAYVVHLDQALNIAEELRQSLSAGALVTTVGLGTPAARAGLLAHDVIMSVNGEPLTSTWHLADALALYEPGQSIKIKIRRAGEEQELTVTLENVADLLY